MNSNKDILRGRKVLDEKANMRGQSCQPACPVCGGTLIEIRAKLQCSKCHRICETCCEGGRG